MATSETEALYCIGCGAKLQTTDPKAPGYLRRDHGEGPG